MAPASDEGTPEADANAADALIGRWRAAEGAVVEIAKLGGGYSGVVVSSTKTPALRGKQILRALTYDATRARWNGQVYAVRIGEWLPATIRLDGATHFELTGGSWPFTKQITWTRF